MLGTVSEGKHLAIARAALTLFASDGYERTSVDAIAAEAGVSKRTVYTHYGDKETLFLSVVRETYQGMLSRIGEIIGRVPWDRRDLRSALTACMTEITRSVVRAPDRATLVRLLMAEAPHFPDLIELLHAGQIAPMVAVPLERLASSGQLAATDVRQAADDLMALTFGRVSERSLMGTLPVSDEEAARIVTSGVKVFLRAYGATEAVPVSA